MSEQFTDHPIAGFVLMVCGYAVCLSLATALCAVFPFIENVDGWGKVAGRILFGAFVVFVFSFSTGFATAVIFFVDDGEEDERASHA